MNRRSLLWLFTIALICAAGCSHPPPMETRAKLSLAGELDCVMAEYPPEGGNLLDAGCYTFFRPAERAEQRDLFFAKEYGAVNQRRHKNEFDKVEKKGRPEAMVGLALSGGGMRANAFHLGILAGLQETGILEFEGKQLLDRIDYISSVSGGTWALAAYLFNDDRVDGTNIFRPCTACGPINDRVPHFLVNRQGEIHRENWRLQVGHDFVAAADCPYTDLTDLAVLDRKPYFIINATHSAMFAEVGSERNFNFQFTRDSLGTTVDCRSQSGKALCGTPRKLRWLALRQGLGAGFFVNNNDKGKAAFALKVNEFLQGTDFKRDLRLTDVLAASSAVVSKLYGFYLKVKPRGKEIPRGVHDQEWFERNGIRGQYRLSDGGKSENIGVLPLVERGVPIIVASQIAEDVHSLRKWWQVWEPDDKGPKFGNLKMLANQIKILFGDALDAEKLDRQIERIERQITEKTPAGDYRIIAEARFGKTPGKDSGWKLFFIKPTYNNIEDFKTWLKEQRANGSGPEHELYAAAFRAIEEDKDIYESKKGEYSRCHKAHFPQNPTFCEAYPMDLVRAYYLLGRYIVRKKGLGEKVLGELGLTLRPETGPDP